jgi:hypothetical protein
VTCRIGSSLTSQGGMRGLAKPNHDHGETINYSGLKRLTINHCGGYEGWGVEGLMAHPHSSNYGAPPHNTHEGRVRLS